MIILGIDPGIAITGYAIIEFSSDKIKPLKYGVIKTNKKEFYLRIKDINKKIQELIENYNPKEAVLEKIFFNKNRKTGMEIAEVRGSIILTLIQNNLKITSYTPLQVKQSVTGYGAATKYQIQNMIKILLNLKKSPYPDDAADAIALTLCHINNMKFNSILKKSNDSIY